MNKTWLLLVKQMVSHEGKCWHEALSFYAGWVKAVLPLLIVWCEIRWHIGFDSSHRGWRQMCQPCVDDDDYNDLLFFFFFANFVQWLPPPHPTIPVYYDMIFVWSEGDSRGCTQLAFMQMISTECCASCFTWCTEWQCTWNMVRWTLFKEPSHFVILPVFQSVSDILQQVATKVVFFFVIYAFSNENQRGVHAIANRISCNC
jgi:hypothetical protein